MQPSVTTATSNTKRLAVRWPHVTLRDEWDRGVFHEGATEPWTLAIVESLILATGAETVLELGAYQGHAAAWFALTLQMLGHGTYIGVEMDEPRAKQTATRLNMLRDEGNLNNVQFQVIRGEAVEVLKRLQVERPGTVDLAWVDDDHSAGHVNEELNLLLGVDGPRIMAEGGIICMHDVMGIFRLAGVCAVHHGYSLDLPRIHAAGGIGIIQV